MWLNVLIIYLGFTGIDQEYEIPSNPDLVARTAGASVFDSMMQVVNLLVDKVFSNVF